jgi:hypothetical protein
MIFSYEMDEPSSSVALDLPKSTDLTLCAPVEPMLSGSRKTTDLTLFEDDAALAEERFVAKQDLGRVIDERLGELGAIDGQVRLGGDDGNTAGVVELAERLRRLVARRAATDDEDAGLLGGSGLGRF